MDSLHLSLYLLLIHCVSSYPDFPANEYEYSIKRDWLKEAERNYEGKHYDLSPTEMIVNNYLQYLKWEEFMVTQDTDFPPSRPIEDMMEHIMASDVYRVLLTFPKGGNMHTHENHQLSKVTLLDLAYNSTDFDYLYILPENHTTDPWMMDFFVNPPETAPGEPDWVKVKDSGYSKEEILQKQTFLGILSDEAKNRPTDTRMRWNELDTLWGRMSNVINNVQIKEKYIEKMIYASLDDGVQYLETRKNLGPDETIYMIDPDYEANNGKRPLGDAELEINITSQIVEQIQQERPEFIGMTRIMYTSRKLDFNKFVEEMERAVYLHNKYPNDVAAFDMVGEEDAGNSHLYFLRSFLQLYNNETARSDVALKMHTSETNWPDDLITSNNELDPAGTLQNTYESILWGVNRIGHGLGYVKHPYLLTLLKERDIAIEICPVSNQIIGFTPDLRNHPAINYIRDGVPVILGSDDPGTFGYDHFTIDWYEAYMAWGIDLQDLKNLATNSLYYSSMSDEDAEEAVVNKWYPVYNNYITTIASEACATNFNTQPQFAGILPKDGALDGGTRMHLFGRHFEKAICNDVICRFGSTEQEGLYVTQNHIICMSPTLADGEGPTVQVDISVDGGQSYLPTGYNFTYMYEDYMQTTPPMSSAQKLGTSIVSWFSLVVTLILVLHIIV